MKFSYILIAVIISLVSVKALQKRNYKKGKFMIVGLFPITTRQKCENIQKESVLLVEKFIYLVKDIEVKLEKMDFSVGYSIWDSCSKTNIANALKDIVNNANDKNSTDGKLVAVVGPAQLENIVKTSALLSYFNMPQVIYTSQTWLLSNPLLFSSLTSVVPSISNTVSVLHMLVTSFNWKSINVIISNDMYSQEFTSLLYESLQHINSCITTSKLIDNTTLKLQIHKAISSMKSNPQTSVTVLLTRPEITAKVLEEARRQNVTRHVWIGTERWTGHKAIADKYSDVLEGGLGIVNTGNHDEGFANYMDKMLRGVKYVDWLKSLFGSNSSSCPNNQVIEPRDIQTDYLGLLSSALKAIRFALEKVLNNMTNDESVNTTTHKWNHLHFKEEFIRVTQQYVNNQPKSLIVVNYQRIKTVTVGQWISNETKKDIIVPGTIRWPGGKTRAPFSGPVSPCPPGTYVKMDIKGCGWTCVKCPVGTFSENYSSPFCKTCPRDKIPNALRTSCLIAEKEYIRLFDVYGICILSASAFGFMITGVVLGIFLKYQNTPVIKASNIGFCLFTLVLLLVWFLSSILFLGEPKDWACKLRTVGVPLLYTSVSALLLTKTKRLIRIFSSLKQNRFLSNYWYSFVACSIVLVQVIFSAVYLVFFPPERVAIHRNDSIVSTHCSRSLGLEVASFTYNCLLAFLCALFAVKSRNLPETYTEAKHICLTMLSYMVSWMIYFFGYYGVHRGKLKTAVPSFGVIVGAYAVLFFIFVPKMRIIFFSPEKNTKTAAMAATRKYSIDVACGIQLSICQSSRACERRHTLATLPAYHESGLSASVQSLDTNKNEVETRFSPESLEEAIREVDDIAEQDSVSVDVKRSFTIPLDNGITIKNIAYLQPNKVR